MANTLPGSAWRVARMRMAVNGPVWTTTAGDGWLYGVALDLGSADPHDPDPIAARVVKVDLWRDWQRAPLTRPDLWDAQWDSADPADPDAVLACVAGMWRLAWAAYDPLSPLRPLPDPRGLRAALAAYAATHHAGVDHG